MDNTYYVTYEVVVEVNAKDEEEACYIASQEWWSSGEVINCTVEKA